MSRGDSQRVRSGGLCVLEGCDAGDHKRVSRGVSSFSLSKLMLMSSVDVGNQKHRFSNDVEGDDESMLYFRKSSFRILNLVRSGG